MLIPLRWLLYITTTPAPEPGPEGGTGGFLGPRKKKKHLNVSPGPQNYKVVMAGNKAVHSISRGLPDKQSSQNRINDDEALLMILSNL